MKCTFNKSDQVLAKVKNKTKTVMIKSDVEPIVTCKEKSIYKSVITSNL